VDCNCIIFALRNFDILNEFQIFLTLKWFTVLANIFSFHMISVHIMNYGLVCNFRGIRLGSHMHYFDILSELLIFNVHIRGMEKITFSEAWILMEDTCIIMLIQRILKTKNTNMVW
jgi:hypothetical protein